MTPVFLPPYFCRTTWRCCCRMRNVLNPDRGPGAPSRRERSPLCITTATGGHLPLCCRTSPWSRRSVLRRDAQPLPHRPGPDSQPVLLLRLRPPAAHCGDGGCDLARPLPDGRSGPSLPKRLQHTIDARLLRAVNIRHPAGLTLPRRPPCICQAACRVNLLAVGDVGAL